MEHIVDDCSLHSLPGGLAAFTACRNLCWPPYGPSSLAELFSAQYSDDASVSLPEDLYPFQDVALEAAPLPSFQETYGAKMEDECYNAPASYHHHPHPHPHTPHSQYDFPHYPTTPYHYPQPAAAYDPPPPDSYNSLPHFPSPAAELAVNTALGGPRQRRASLPLQRSESTRSREELGETVYLTWMHISTLKRYDSHVDYE
ncbi:Nuclear receptor sub 4 group A member 2 [Homalodisca vitripennis]|nr:Nuclear receptor sub 4 group A member 2 [Homalodisca vitripennis]